jgi:hypothetical protein
VMARAARARASLTFLYFGADGRPRLRSLFRDGALDAWTDRSRMWRGIWRDPGVDVKSDEQY